MPALDLTTMIVGSLLVGLWLSFIAYFATDPWWRPARFAGKAEGTGPPERIAAALEVRMDVGRWGARHQSGAPRPTELLVDDDALLAEIAAEGRARVVIGRGDAVMSGVRGRHEVHRDGMPILGDLASPDRPCPGSGGQH
jgi:hypothetical protein